MTQLFKNFIDGEYREPSAAEAMDIFNPADGKVYAQAPISTEKDVDDAFKSAGRAFEDWRLSTPAERQLALLKIADAFEARAEELLPEAVHRHAADRARQAGQQCGSARHIHALFAFRHAAPHPPPDQLELVVGKATLTGQVANVSLASGTVLGFSSKADASGAYKLTTLSTSTPGAATTMALSGISGTVAVGMTLITISGNIAKTAGGNATSAGSAGGNAGSAGSAGDNAASADADRPAAPSHRIRSRSLHRVEQNGACSGLRGFPQSGHLRTTALVMTGSPARKRHPHRPR